MTTYHQNCKCITDDGCREKEVSVKYKAGELLVKYLEQEGVEYVFEIPGGVLKPINNALSDSKKITPILTKHEEGAAFMACGYARVSGKLGVCMGTSGPGSTNMMTGVASSLPWRFNADFGVDGTGVHVNFWERRTAGVLQRMESIQWRCINLSRNIVLWFIKASCSRR